jgi:hypothetical protein
MADAAMSASIDCYIEAVAVACLDSMISSLLEWLAYLRVVLRHSALDFWLQKTKGVAPAFFKLLFERRLINK